MATDDALAIVGRYRRFAALIKEKVPNLLTVYCVLQRQHLVPKKLRGELRDDLKECIRSINKVKAHLKSRLFAMFCEKYYGKKICKKMMKL